MHTLFDFITYTKGIEYLMAIAFLLLFVVFWRLATVPPAGRKAPGRVAEWAGKLEEVVGGFLLPENVFFHPGHAWAKVEDENLVAVGMDDFGQKLIGRLETVNAPALGTVLRQGERAWTIQAGGKTIEMLSPVDGTVASINHAALQNPEIINGDPFGQGWLIKVLAPRKAANFKTLLSGVLAKRWLEEARAKLMAGSDYALGTVLTDAGPARAGIARSIDPEHWDELVKDFFLTAKD